MLNVVLIGCGVGVAGWGLRGGGVGCGAGGAGVRGGGCGVGVGVGLRTHPRHLCT